MAAKRPSAQGFSVSTRARLAWLPILFLTATVAARADTHRADRIAVVAVLHDDDARARRADIAEIAECHLERDLDGGRAGRD